jgi:hypothetical protein
LALRVNFALEGASRNEAQFAGRAMCHKFCGSKPLVSPGAVSALEV